MVILTEGKKLSVFDHRTSKQRYVILTEGKKLNVVRCHSMRCFTFVQHDIV